jgi:signal recognition particle subunit SRP14
MGRFSNDGFLTALDKQFNKVRVKGSLYITFKRYCPKPTKKGKPNPEGSDPLCLIRAKLGSNCISTVVPQKDVPRFQSAFGTILKGNMDALKKPEKEKKEKKKKGAAAHEHI